MNHWQDEKLKKLFLTILAVMLAGCVTSSENDLNIANSVPEKKEKRFPQEFNKQHKPPGGLKLTSVLYELASAPDLKILQRNIIFSCPKRGLEYTSHLIPTLQSQKERR